MIAEEAIKFLTIKVTSVKEIIIFCLVVPSIPMMLFAVTASLNDKYKLTIIDISFLVHFISGDNKN